MPYDANSAEAKAGEICERWVDHYYRVHCGYSRIPISMQRDGAAVWYDEHNRAHVAFDRLYFKRRMGMRWIDIKGKSGPLIHQITDSLRHGIDLPLWRAYVRMSQETGIGGSLAVVELKRHRNGHELAPLLLHQTLHILAKRQDTYSICDYPTDGFPHGAIFWPRAAFDILGPIGLGNMPLPVTRLNLHPWELRDNAGRIRMPPDRPRQPDLFEETDWDVGT